MEAFYREIAEQEKAAAIASQPDFAKMDLEGLANSGMIYEIFGKYICPLDKPIPETALREQGMGALADLITGKTTPSGKLAQTLAKCYEDYPSAKHMSYNKDDTEGILTYESYGLSAEENGSKGFDKSPVTVYQEGIYVGYRYFDSFRKEVMYPFGYGLSYAEFCWKYQGAEIKDGQIIVKVDVENKSAKYSGKEVLQLYVHASSGLLEQPYQELKAVEKTKLLRPDEKQELVLKVKLEELASVDEERNACIMEKGGEIPQLHISPADLRPDWPAYKGYDFTVPAKESTLQDVCEGRVSMESFLNQMTAEELAVLCNGYGPGLPFGGLGQQAPSTIQYEDGPASVGKTAWPTGMMFKQHI